MTLSIRHIAIASLFSLAGCASAHQNLTASDPEFEQFLAGKAEQSCQISCATSWGYHRRKLRKAHDKEDWQFLALKVLTVGHQSDLAYYYLGRSAEGLGYGQAAIQYYREGLKISHLGTDRETEHVPGRKCGLIFDNCDDFVFPADIEARLRPLEDYFQ